MGRAMICTLGLHKSLATIFLVHDCLCLARVHITTSVICFHVGAHLALTGSNVPFNELPAIALHAFASHLCGALYDVVPRTSL